MRNTVTVQKNEIRRTSGGDRAINSQGLSETNVLLGLVEYLQARETIASFGHTRIFTILSDNHFKIFFRLTT
jgi:hypothetical protein